MAPDLRTELLELSRAFRSHLDEHVQSGSWELPPSPPTSRVTSIPVEATAAATGGEATPASPIRRNLSMLRQEAAECTACNLHQERTQSVFSRGTGSSGLAFVGEGPGHEEDLRGLPFVGPAGQLLDRMITAMKLSPEEVYVCNIVKCRPPKNRKPEPREMASCRPFLEEQLAQVKPRVIVALGATAVQGLLGATGGITRMRGQWKVYQGTTPVMPTFHPAYLLRQPSAKRDVWRDLQAVVAELARG